MKTLFLVLPVILIIGWLLFVNFGDPLQVFVSRVEASLPAPQIGSSELTNLLEQQDGNPPLLFDVRRPDEFAVSHLEGARQVDYGMKPLAFIEKFGQEIRGRQLIFYCSIGYRSSKFLKKVEQLCLQNDASAVFNLRGGIFTWYNEARPVFNQDGETTQVHPYGPMWQFLIRRDPQ